MEGTELEALLSKYRMTFNWSEGGKKWWLIGQAKGSNTLRSTEPQKAADREAGQVAAVEFIHQMFKAAE